MRAAGPCYDELSDRFCFPIAHPTYFQDAALEITEHIAERDRCEQLPLEEIYRRPQDYSERHVCTSGFLLSWRDERLLVPSITFDADSAVAVVMLTDDRGLFSSTDTDGTRVNLAGWLTVDPGCFAEDLEEEGQCERIEAPVYMDIIELERDDDK